MEPVSEPITSNTTDAIQHLIDQIETVIRGKRRQIEMVVTCLLAGGHILIEDNPGTGKTVLAKTLAQCISGEMGLDHVVFKRIQFTPDLLPMDLIGTHIFDDRTKEFVFKKGPLFCNVLLADEINRASPKVQSALLEAMAEHQVTVGDTTLKLEKMFFTIATQNPIEMEGTYPLPAAQLDRFFMKIYFGYVDEEVEMNIYREYLDIAQNLIELKQNLSMNDILSLQQQSSQVFVHDEIVRSVSHIVRDTREHQDIALGASTRSGIAFLKCLRAYALVKGRTFVIEDDVKDIARWVLDHRLMYRNKDGRLKALDGIINKEVDRLAKLKLYA
ncbi:AAA family ATPase [Polluticoccus soli]|uniref:AAA family ATPase n=1 Tax=Polluticoccus soli TaxID=3034150 RepID=UPI0023E2EADB|nr:MoxR family ATPase [Flavipsychrobacter sp. JY13-12]